MSPIITRATLLLLSVLTIPSLSEAQRPGRMPLPRESRMMQQKAAFEAREGRQLERIYDGLLDGSLTWPEAQRLFREQARIERTIMRAVRDSRLRRTEIRRISRMQDRASTHIRFLRHNRLTRAGVLPLRPRIQRRGARRNGFTPAHSPRLRPVRKHRSTTVWSI